MDEYCMYSELLALIRLDAVLFDALRAAMREYGYNPYATADEGMANG